MPSKVRIKKLGEFEIPKLEGELENVNPAEFSSLVGRGVLITV